MRKGHNQGHIIIIIIISIYQDKGQM